MGHAKQKQLEDDYNGFNADGYETICERHFQDDDIINFIQLKGEAAKTCSFCERGDFDEDESDVKSISWQSLLCYIVPCIKRSYDDPANGRMYLTSEGGYDVEPHSSLELLQEVIELDADDHVVEAIANSLTNEFWTEAEFYGDKLSDHLSYNWENFCELIKTEVRYVFSDVRTKNALSNTHNSPSRILEEIGKAIIEMKLIRSFPLGSNLFDQSFTIYRARAHQRLKEVRTARDIGSSPHHKTKSNRFSAEGISMFYGADKKETAIKEIGYGLKGNKYVSIGRFKPARKLNLIDFCDFKSVGFFNGDLLNKYEASLFLSRFIRNISQPIVPSANERIEYIPSQVVTEYFRHVLTRKSKLRIDGIAYNSALVPDKVCYVIFANQYQCVDEGEEDEDTLLILEKKSISRYKIKDGKVV